MPSNQAPAQPRSDAAVMRLMRRLERSIKAEQAVLDALRDRIQKKGDPEQPREIFQRIFG